MVDITKIRADFPSLTQRVYDKPLVYLDNAATSQTPRCVIDALTEGYEMRKANVHRGVHTLSQLATDAMEASREAVRRFLNAPSVENIIFTRGTTESLNLVACSYGQLLHEGDEVIVSQMEHHSNIVPWQLLQQRRGIVLKVVPITPDGLLDMAAYAAMFTERTKLVSICHSSNVLGTVNDVQSLTQIAHSHHCVVCIDGAQAVPHRQVDVAALDCDFYAFSAHKMYGSTGVGVLYGKRALLDAMPPYQGGGEMIGHVSFAGTTWADLPYKFEAGTPDFIGVTALARAIAYMEQIGIDNIGQREQALLRYAEERLADIPDIRIFGHAPEKSAVISFLIGNAHHYDTGMLLDKMGIAVRTGHHCAQPLMDALGVEGTVRASFAFYNTEAEIDALHAALLRLARILRG